LRLTTQETGLEVAEAQELGKVAEAQKLGRQIHSQSVHKDSSTEAVAVAYTRSKSRDTTIASSSKAVYVGSTIALRLKELPCAITIPNLW
jgi:hypothetical protein